MLNKQELCKFLVEAKKSTYASRDSAQKIINKDNSTTLIFKKGDWEYNDNYFGGEPYGGREVVFLKNKPVYIMVYYGLVDNSVNDINKVYRILMNALKLIPKDKPYRGPEKYSEENLIYQNNFTGEIDNFFGEEIIKKDGIKIYQAKYMGGFVDVKK
jgi:hypothetical protein